MVEPPQEIGSSIRSLGCRSPLGFLRAGASAVGATRRMPHASLLASKLGATSQKASPCQPESSVTFYGGGSTRSDGDSVHESSPPPLLVNADGPGKTTEGERGGRPSLSAATSDAEETGLSCDMTPVLVTLSPSCDSPRLYRHLVFVYGTLKRGMPNHHIFTRIASEVEEETNKSVFAASDATPVAATSDPRDTGVACLPDTDAESSEDGPRQAVYLFDAVTTEAYPLFVDANQRYRPCLFDARGVGEKVRGEVYAVTDDILRALDTFERVPDHYNRRHIRVEVVQDSAPLGSPSEVVVHVYFNMHMEVLARVLGTGEKGKRDAEGPRANSAHSDRGTRDAQQVTYLHNYDSSHAQLYVPRFRPPENGVNRRLPCAKGVFRAGSVAGPLGDCFSSGKDADIRRSTTLPALHTSE
ncbi:hypothetical protein NCLIV_017090 [Neospora caninum Liverpool]|uniref:Gamma-glutamylaminecyclotransferase B n=1 Tax=Neospora caninum (strain Liverpool) TaxID=572307 RepID=F0VDX4_NEOCL|nr:hypothetical protein NCLIV_017090 [Neospora caninum Liverpool]CBZ51917.1 hypothetical protein NCLIV_017090 [Neospora caninum Liverpool]CEL65879.1 TPA: Gamma-glutamylaminecyclotransferase B [Neospora caninum Liverpool]|eukprot:XP_003881950.1 hypothetical protein NCLIV_017090 [Neospora caninum Liverpool]